MRCRLGLKMWSTDSYLLEDARNLIDEGLFSYIEVMPVPGTSVIPFADMDLDYIIHAPTEKFGLNLGDSSSGQNNDLISMSEEWADCLNASYIVLHPGYGNIGNVFNTLESISDSRFCIENMPKFGLEGEHMIGYSPEEIQALCKTGCGFCLDLNHAVKAAIASNMQPSDLIESFIRLKPRMCHIADGNLNSWYDEHLSLGEGEYDLAYMKRCLCNLGDIPVTLETPKISGSLENDRRNSEYLKEI